MTVRSIFTATAAAAALAATLAIGTATSASAFCKGHFHDRNATGAFETPTEFRARARWRSTVRAHDGAAWARWSRAKDKTMRCHKTQPGNQWHCMARARPCNT